MVEKFLPRARKSRGIMPAHQARQRLLPMDGQPFQLFEKFPINKRCRHVLSARLQQLGSVRTLENSKACEKLGTAYSVPRRSQCSQKTRSPSSPRGQSGLSPIFRPVHSARRFHSHRCPRACSVRTHACRVATRGAAQSTHNAHRAAPAGSGAKSSAVSKKNDHQRISLLNGRPLLMNRRAHARNDATEDRLRCFPFGVCVEV